MALKSAVDLGIADTIQHHGGAATLSQIANKAMVPPSKTPCLSRLMRTLTSAGVFNTQQQPASSCDSEQLVYTLTPVSRLLVGSRNLSTISSMVLHPAMVCSLFELSGWLQSELPEPGMFKLRNGHGIVLINNGMASDTEFIIDIAIKEHGEVLFQGVSSLIDVAGGFGAAAHAISKAFPHVRCSVLDLAHVVEKAPGDTDVKYIAGDMFESIPPANVIFLKWILHDWGDEECVKILKNCKKAIPPREKGGKVVIIDIVVGVGGSDSDRQMQVIFDLFMMVINGTERDENQWKKIFFQAGFSDYKITPVLGFRSIIELYP
ncbi:hypothetical protein HU200_055760 [Digitaria exilis]|uniref:O-methyltransferase ZRP4 n=1 Tax=Digitaria exilis TaxID=1010633 RepID=A0A835AMT3_9POAL|nr:hypothetical protein HU200_055760 [Digitaria exilis]